MLTWDPDNPRPADVYAGIGWGSVSDQQGMNKAFRALGLPFYYRRDWRGGGPRIEQLARGDK